MQRTNKLFLIILPVLFFVAVGVLGLSLKRIGVGTCGCGDPLQANGEFEANQAEAYFQDHTVVPPLALLPVIQSSVLGETTAEEKWIEVDLSDQKLTAWQGNEKFLETLVSTGKWGRTPVGDFRIWSKFKYTKMSGGSKALNTYYNLPNVPYTMYFYKDFGLHGTYWHNNFGVPMSHGCVNLPTIMAEKLFYWTTPVLAEGKNSVIASQKNPGTRVVVHD
jgi:hypothetical protein